jgi:hypothetical protein
MNRGVDGSMKKEMLCSWLGLPNAAWPPDPWALLGLQRGVYDLTVVEERVQDRLAKLRPYQLSYPEEATEGMNRLAEAFVALTQTGKPTAAQATVAKDETATNLQTKLDWQDETTQTKRHPEPAAKPGDPILVAKPFAPPRKFVRGEIDRALLCGLAEHSEEATSNVGTIDAVIDRVEDTRKLLCAWERVGAQMKAAGKKPLKAGEHFTKHFATIAEVLTSYPAFVGHPGKPGYRVAAMARLQIPLPVIRAMTPDQREAMLVDWEMGYQVLLMHRKFLRRLFRKMRRRSALSLTLHAARAFLNDHPSVTYFGIVVLIALALLGIWRFAFRG